MPDLLDLRKAIAELVDEGKSGRVYFYAHGAQAGSLRYGYFAIAADGTCTIDYAKKSNDDALADILGIDDFLKIVFMPADASASPNPPLPARAVLDRLQPQAVQSPKPAGGSLAAGAAGPIEASVPADEPTALTELQAAELMRQVAALLAQFYGSAADQKVDEAAALFPPARLPAQFLNECRQHLTIMVGPDKANRLFEPLYARIAL